MNIINLIFFISSGHFRNIHFPFDIEMDTSTDVASEMVEELDLTYHDVSVIATMIDSEVQSHIPDWVPRELYGRNKATTSEASESTVTSPTTTELTKPIVMERLPSGRKYWSDSPKASAGNSPLKHGNGPSNLVLTESVVHRESWFEENNQSPSSHKDNRCYEEGSCSRHVEDDDSDNDGCANKKVDLVPISLSSGDVCHGHDGSYDDENIISSQIDLDDKNNNVKKLEHLLDEQQKELDELKKKHELAISDILKELPEEIRLRFLSICNRNRSEHNFHYKGMTFDN